MTLEDSYNAVIAPINTGVGGQRNYQDSIALSYTKGKLSPDEELKKLQIRQAELDLARSSALPGDIETQRFSWEQQAAAAAATQLDIQRAEEARAVEAAAFAEKTGRLELASGKQSLKAGKQQMGLARRGEQREQQAFEQSVLSDAIATETALQELNKKFPIDQKGYMLPMPSVISQNTPGKASSVPYTLTKTSSGWQNVPDAPVASSAYGGAVPYTVTKTANGWQNVPNAPAPVLEPTTTKKGGGKLGNAYSRMMR